MKTQYDNGDTEVGGKLLADTSAVFRGDNSDGVAITTGDMAVGDVLVVDV